MMLMMLIDEDYFSVSERVRACNSFACVFGILFFCVFG